MIKWSVPRTVRQVSNKEMLSVPKVLPIRHWEVTAELRGVYYVELGKGHSAEQGKGHSHELKESYCRELRDVSLLS